MRVRRVRAGCTYPLPLSSFGAGTDVAAEILGYFLEDPAGNGVQGPKGQIGPMGPQGAAGPQGPPGPPGTIGGASGTLTFPPGSHLTVNDSRITASSLVIPWYVGGSLGNAIAVDSQSDGTATFSGSPNKSFRYVILN